MDDGRVVIVGGGIAGLVCAIELDRAGRRVLLLEREVDVGGRVRSRTVDGFTIDRGFQVLFTAYPTLRAYLDLDALRLRDFLPAARIAEGGRDSLVGDAARAPGLLLDTIASPALSLADKLRVLKLRRLATSLSIDDCFDARFDAITTHDFLRARGFSADGIRRFFAPFYGGILLDRTLSTSASLLLFTFKMLAEGRTAVPAAGMGAVSAQLAARLRPGTVRTGAHVVDVDVRDGRACGVRLGGGETIDAAHVVLATEWPDALLPGAAPRRQPALGCTTVYYSADEAPLPGRALWLDADERATVSHAVTMTDVAPEYATSGATSDAPRRHLLAATALGESARLDDETLVERARADVLTMRGGQHARAVPDLRLVAIERIAHAQFAQPPGSRERRASVRTPVERLWRASETVHTSSLEGAARGGLLAARAVAASSV